jgi:hypothetical protein
MAQPDPASWQHFDSSQRPHAERGQLALRSRQECQLHYVLAVQTVEMTACVRCMRMVPAGRSSLIRLKQVTNCRAYCMHCRRGTECCSMALVPLLSYAAHSSLVPRRPAHACVITAAARSRPRKPCNINHASHARQQRSALRANKQSGADREPSAAPDALSHDSGQVSPPQTDAAPQQNGTGASSKGSSKVQRKRPLGKWQDVVSPVADASRNVAALSGILGGLLQQQQQRQPALPSADSPAASDSEAQQQQLTPPPPAQTASAASAQPQQDKRQQESPGAVQPPASDFKVPPLQQQPPPVPGQSGSAPSAAGPQRVKRQAAATKPSTSPPGQGTSTPAAAQPSAPATEEQWQVPARFRPASAAAAAGGKPSIEQIMVERKFEKKVQCLAWPV